MNFISKNNKILLEEEIQVTQQAITELEKLIETGNKDEIHSAIEKLNSISTPFAERVMDEAIGKAMKGKKV